MRRAEKREGRSGGQGEEFQTYFAPKKAVTATGHDRMHWENVNAQGPRFQLVRRQIDEV